MQATVFSKSRTTTDGRQFYSYFARLNKAGEEIVVELKFKNECGAPHGENCPMNIVFDKQDANYTEKQVSYTDKNGEEKDAVRRLMWISKWSEGEPYEDHSMDDFE